MGLQMEKNCGLRVVFLKLHLSILRHPDLLSVMRFWTLSWWRNAARLWGVWQRGECILHVVGSLWDNLTSWWSTPWVWVRLNDQLFSWAEYNRSDRMSLLIPGHKTRGFFLDLSLSHSEGCQLSWWQLPIQQEFRDAASQQPTRS